MNPSVSTLFSINIIEGQVDADFDKLEKLLLDNYSKRWSDDPTHTRYEDSCCPSSPLVDDIFDQVLDDLYKVTEEEVFVSDYWGHIHEKNMSTSPHCHRGSLAAGVIYIAAPEGAGSIVFRSNFDIANKNAFIKSFPPVRIMPLIFKSANKAISLFIVKGIGMRSIELSNSYHLISSALLTSTYLSIESRRCVIPIFLNGDTSFRNKKRMEITIHEINKSVDDILEFTTE